MPQFVVHLNGGAGRKAKVEAATDLEAARVFWAWDNQEIEQPPLYVWVRQEGVARAVCVLLNTATGQTCYAKGSNKQDA